MGQRNFHSLSQFFKDMAFLKGDKAVFGKTTIEYLELFGKKCCKFCRVLLSSWQLVLISDLVKSFDYFFFLLTPHILCFLCTAIQHFLLLSFFSRLFPLLILSLLFFSQQWCHLLPISISLSFFLPLLLIPACSLHITSTFFGKSLSARFLDMPHFWQCKLQRASVSYIWTEVCS